MYKHEAYSVLITNKTGKRVTGTLFYQEGADHFYVFTCAHMIYTSETVSIQILIPNGDDDPIERTIIAEKTQFHFSPIDEPTIIGDDSTHTCDIAVIECPVDDLPIKPTQLVMVPMRNRDAVIAVGFPRLSGPLYYQQDTMKATVEKALNQQHYFLIRVEDRFLNSADRESELKGFSGAPVWEEEQVEQDNYLYGGLISGSDEPNIGRASIKVMHAKVIRSLLRDDFGINIQMCLPNIPKSDVAPGITKQQANKDQIIVRDSWIKNEWSKAQTFVDSLQLIKAVETAKTAIANTEFIKCSTEQKYKLYAVLLEAYRLARDYDIYDKIRDEMHQAGISDNREYLIEAVRCYEALDNEKAEEYITKALETDPDDNSAKAFSLAIKAANDENANISILSSIIGPQDQLLITPKDNREEESIYQAMGFVLGNRFKETERSIRCLNRAFQVSGNYIILESLAEAYYIHSLRNAYIEEGSDRIDPSMIDAESLENARDLFLRVLSAADEMWLKGTIRRVGPLMFKCFVFTHDNFRVYKHYHDIMRYYEFQDNELLRDVQICYLESAIMKGPVPLDDYHGLTAYDKKYFELLILLNRVSIPLSYDTNYQNAISEVQLSQTISDGEARLNELIEIQTDNKLGFERVHTILINLFGKGIQLYKWNAVAEVKKHFAEIKHPLGIESLNLYIYELETNDFFGSEQKYREFFEKKKDVSSFNEWCHFYLRNGMVDKVKELYDSILDERSFLLKTQSEFFYREYIFFYVNNRYDLTVPIKCFVDHADDIRDIFIKLLIEMELELVTGTLNDPDYMLETAKSFLDEGLIDLQEYNRRCLYINMLNCRPFEAEKYVHPMHMFDPCFTDKFERMLLVWKGCRVEPDPHWSSMQRYSLAKLNDIYSNEEWLNPVDDILERLSVRNRKVITVDLWTLYYLQENQVISILNCFDKVYITHNTLSAALQEMSHVNDDIIRAVLNYIETSNNIVFRSPTIKEQLLIRGQGFAFMEIHHALLLAELLDCPAFVGEFRFPIPDRFKDRIIRPNHFTKLQQHFTEIDNKEI